jgi:ATP-dependent DNA helicase
MNMQALLDKSTIYTEALKEQMDRSREKHASVAATTQTRTPKPKQKQRAGRSGWHVSGSRKRVRQGSDDEEDGDEHPKRVRAEAKPAFVQPALVTGAKLRDYQLEGVAWMVSLWENGISGILGKSSKLPVCSSSLICLAQRTRWVWER